MTTFLQYDLCSVAAVTAFLSYPRLQLPTPLQQSMMALLVLLQHPLVQFVQVQGCLILLVGVLGWSWSGVRRRREGLRLASAGYGSALAAVTAAAPVTVQFTDMASAQLKSPKTHCGHGGTQGCSCITGEVKAVEQWQLAASAATSWQQHQQQAVQHQAGKVHIEQQQDKQLLGHHRDQQQSVLGDAAASAVAHPVQHIFKSKAARQAGWPGVCAGRSCWPSLAVVCPVKGCRPHSKDNWTSQLAALYAGPYLFVFVVEAKTDTAVVAIRELMTQQGRVALTEQQRAELLLQQQQQHQQQQHQQQHHQVLDAWQYQAQPQQRQLDDAQPPAAAAMQVVLLVESGPATTCSQKIHNILAGIAAALSAQKLSLTAPVRVVLDTNDAQRSPGYVCLLDDDVSLHPFSLGQLVDTMEHDNTLFMATGYPFDIVTWPTDSSWANSSWIARLLMHAAASYHLPLLIGFSVADKGNFVWGGAMMLRAAYLQQGMAAQAGQASTAAADGCRPPSAAAAAATATSQDDRHILQVWREGGYSDDLLLASYCAATQRSIGLPASALFPQLLAPGCTWTQYWNYLRRQLFVLDTYYNRHNQVINHTMMIAHSYGSAVFTMAAAGTCVQLTILLLLLLGLSVCWAMQVLQHYPSFASIQHVIVPVCASLSGSCGVHAAGDSSQQSCSTVETLAGNMVPACACCFSAHAEHAEGDEDSNQQLQPEMLLQCVWQLMWRCGTGSTWLFCACVVAAQCAMGFMYRQVFGMFRVLSPYAKPQVAHPRVSWVLLWAGWLLSNTVLPFCMLYTYLCNHIEWSGIVYHKKSGKVVRVVHKQGQ